MTPDDFQKLILRNREQMVYYNDRVFGRRMGEIALRFIDANFNMQGWQGAEFGAWKPLKKPRPGKILIKSGTLMRNNLFRARAGEVRIYNDTPYARIHNNGFSGTISVRAYQRRNFKVKTLGNGRLSIKGKQVIRNVHQVSGTVNVQAHTRNVNVPQRQFMPMSYRDSPVLLEQMKADMKASISKIIRGRL